MLGYKVRIPLWDLMNHKTNINDSFKSMVSEIKMRMPFLTLVYGFINSKDPSERIQVMLIFSFKGKGGGSDITKYLIFLANESSYFSLDGYDICRQKGKLDEWFEDFQDKPVVYPINFVKDMIQDSEGVLPKTATNPEGRLSWSDTDPDAYWKNPKNALLVAKQLDKYASMYDSIASKGK